MGGDNLIQFPRWYRWQDIARTIPIVVFDRENNTFKGLQGKFARRYAKNRLTDKDIRYITKDNPPSWGFIRLRKHPASATEIRKTLDKSAFKGYN